MKVNLKLLAAQLVVMPAIYGLVLFLAAGTAAWPAGWIYLILFFGSTSAMSLWLLKNNPGLLIERMTGIGKPDQKAWDKAFYVLMGALYLAWLALMGLDAVRFHWAHLPVWLQAAGALVLLCSFHVFFLTFRENPYLSPAVRVQAERGQTVISSGLYRHVRHPMYAAIILYTLGSSLLLGSSYGLLFGLVMATGLARRAVLEERALSGELPGYDAYMARVKYRFIPHVW